MCAARPRRTCTAISVGHRICQNWIPADGPMRVMRGCLTAQRAREGMWSCSRSLHEFLWLVRVMESAGARIQRQPKPAHAAEPTQSMGNHLLGWGTGFAQGSACGCINHMVLLGAARGAAWCEPPQCICVSVRCQPSCLGVARGSAGGDARTALGCLSDRHCSLFAYHLMMGALPPPSALRGS